MSVLMIVESTIEPSTAHSVWLNNYLSQVPEIVKSYGGKYLTRTNHVTLIEGSDASQSCVVAHFPTKEAAMQFYHSEQYQPFKDMRIEHATSKVVLAEIENGS